MATRWPLVAWAALDGAVQRCASLAAAKGAAAVAHGVAHLLLLVADARNLPGVRAAPGTRRRGRGARRHRGTGEIDVGL